MNGPEVRKYLEESISNLTPMLLYFITNILCFKERLSVPLINFLALAPPATAVEDVGAEKPTNRRRR